MPPVDAAEFRSRLRDRSRSELAALVETLWDARGHDVRRDDEFVVVGRETGDEEVILPVAASRTDRWLPPREPRRPEATTVVLAGARAPTWAQEDDLRIVDADELRELLLYAVDAETRDAVLADVFGVDPTDADREPNREDAASGGDDERSWLASVASLGPGRSAAIATLGFLLVVGLLIGTVAFGLGPLAGGGDGTTGTDGTPTGVPAGASTPTPVDGSYPPGLSAHGVEDPDALAAAHVDNLSGRSYTMVFRYREVGANHTGTIRETTEVVGETRYASHRDRAGSFATDPANVTDPAVIAGVETYADGEVRYRRIRTDEGVRYERGPVYEGQFPAHASRAAGFVQRTLAAADTRLTGTFERGGLTFYRIRFEADERPAFEDSEGVAVIDEFGVVHLLRTQYHPADRPNVTVTVVLEYTDFRTTELTEPDWLSEFGNATDASTSHPIRPTGRATDRATDHATDRATDHATDRAAT